MQLSDLQGRLLERLGDTATGEYVQVGYYSAQEATNWLNVAQRLFVLLTFCLENTVTLPLSAATAFYRMLPLYPDWLAPLRVYISGGARIQPAKLGEIAALDTAWSDSPGTPARYGCAGFDLFYVYQQPAATGTSLAITYAQCPNTLFQPTDVPAIPVEYHPVLIEGAIPLCKAKEGGSEWQKTLKNWDRFLDGAQKLGDYVRARNKERGYDRAPVELARFDRSKLLMEVANAK